MITSNSTNKTGGRKPIPIHAGGHIVGQVKNGVFSKTVTGSRHFLKVPPAIALSVDSLHQAQAVGAFDVAIYDKETRTTYRASIAHILENGFELNRGFGLQIALPFEGWTKQTKGAYMQQGLFGGGR